LYSVLMQIKQALLWGHEVLLLSSESARLDAEILLSYIIKKPATFLLAHNEEEVGFLNLWRYKRLIEKRKKGVPVAYLTGHREFYFLDFAVNRHVFIPRPDTEILVDSVISYIKNSIFPPRRAGKIQDLKLLDVGTGSGCIPISVLKNIEGIHAVATDISRHALHVAEKNAGKHRVLNRIHFFHSDLLASVPHSIFKGGDVIVTANLPYIPTDFQIHPETKFEPNISLYGGGDGMDIYKAFMKQIESIRPRAIFLELFEFQIAILEKYLSGYSLKRTENMTGQAKMLMLERENFAE